MILLPCNHEIEPKQLLALAGKYRASLRVNKTPGKSPGRPRKLPRCDCGKYTLNRVPKRHVCG